MAGVFGTGVEMPFIDITGFLSSSWIYVAIIVVVGLILIAIISALLFFLTYKRKIVIFENISGQGYQPVIRTRARVLKVNVGGLELLKTLVGGTYLSAYGRKMGKNTYWFAKGQDGFLYNAVLGDLDAKMGMLDIEPIDRDVRMMTVALDRLSQQTYGKSSFLEKYGIHMLLFVFLIVLILGMWFIVGKVGEAVAPLASAGDTAVKLQAANDITISKLDSLIRAMGYVEPTPLNTGSGLVPAGG